jgi:hypothetical protein
MAIDPVERWGIDGAAERCASADRLMRVEVDLRRALVLAMKCAAFPGHPDVGLWLRQSQTLRDGAAMEWAPEMKRRLNVSNVYAWALRAVPCVLDGMEARPLPEMCRFKVNDLLGSWPLDLG